MLRTNSKKAINNLDNYLLSYAEDIAAENENSLLFDYDLTNIHGFADCVLNYYFYDQMIRYDNRYAAGRISHYELFHEWAAGLPLPIFDYFNFGGDAKKILGDILEETEEERNRFSESDAENMLTRIIYNRLVKNADVRRF